VLFVPLATKEINITNNNNNNKTVAIVQENITKNTNHHHDRCTIAMEHHRFNTPSQPVIDESVL
jgi:hypothetical protein